MLNRLATVFQELSGEEGTDGDSQGTLVPQLPPGDEGQTPADSEAPEEALERLAHLEQLVVQLKELIREKDTQLVEKDTQLSGKDAQLKNEKEEAEARFTKLKLQAKAKMASLNKQITDLKGQGGAASPDNSFSGSGVEEELQDLKKKLSEEEAASRELKDRLQATEQLLQEKEAGHAEQLRILQAVVFEKDVRFQEQIQKHEEELLKVTTQSQDDSETQQALQAAQRRCEELQEAFNSHSQDLEMLQQEVSSADQQKQILTSQYRQMEQELAEAVRLREDDRQQFGREVAALRADLEAQDGEREEMGRRESELTALREVVQAERTEVARLEAELTRVRETELAAVEASERDGAEISRLESELGALREAAAAVHGEKSEVEKLEKELANLMAEREHTQQGREVLEETWRILSRLAPETAPEEENFHADVYRLLDTVQAVEMQLNRLKYECSEGEERCAQLTHATESLQDELDRRSSHQEESAVRIHQLEQELSDRSDAAVSSQDSFEADKAHILSLEQQLQERDTELVALRESLAEATKQKSGEAAGENYDQTSHQEVSEDPTDSSATLPNFMEETQEEETTLVAEDTCVLSMSGGNESSPELIGHQSESPEESKGTSSDEMVASSDSEVAHSSWTLLEAMNQDAGQEWSTGLQDVNQSWVATSMEQETSTVQVESSSLVIRETVEVHVSQQSSSSSAEVTAASGQVFAQALAEELQKRYSELLAELQKLKDAAAESQERIRSLEEETNSLTAAKEEAQSQTGELAKELLLAKEEIDQLSQQSSSVVEKHSVEMKLLEEQVEILEAENKVKEQKLEALLSDLEVTQQALSEQEGQARMLSAQLEDREIFSSQLERRLQDMESSMLEYSQTSDLNSESLLLKDSEISELQLRLNQKEQELMELSNSMSAKLLQAEGERSHVDGEVSKLKEQIEELKRVREEEEQPRRSEDNAAPVDDELDSLRKEKGVLETQLTNAKKKLQAALIQRKDLMKRVAEFENEAKKLKEKEEESIPDNIPAGEVAKGYEVEGLEAKLEELQQALRSKEEAVETLELKINQQDQILAETLDLNRKLSEEADGSPNLESSSETTALESQVTSLEAECESLQKKLQEAQESRKETIRKAKEKDRHHREQLKHQKDEYNELMERFELQGGEREALLSKLTQLETKVGNEREELPQLKGEHLEKPSASEWVQEDWVDFAASETDAQTQPNDLVQSHEKDEKEESVKAPKKEDEVKTANKELESKLQETQESLSLKDAEILELGKELQVLREKEKQIDVLSEEIEDLREKHHQAECYAQSLREEMEAAAKAVSEDSTASITALQAEVEDFKQFLENKNQEILELSQQLSQQNSLIHSMQEAVSQKDHLLSSLQQELKTEQEKTQRLEAEVPQKQEEDASEEKRLQQLQRKLQAALISRKDALREIKTQKEQLTVAEKTATELQQKVDSAEEELEKLRAERVRLSNEAEQMFQEKQSLRATCESLKLAMEGIIKEKDAWKREAELGKEEAARVNRDSEEKVQGMKEEYETLLKSYENVSDEAERVRRVLEAARQERQELTARVRTHEAARQEAERQAEEAQKEVDVVKDKMRKFAKTKQQKILDLEEENERLREMEERPVKRGGDKALRVEVEGLQEELTALKAELEATVEEKDSLSLQITELREQLTQKGDPENSKDPQISEAVVEEVVTAQLSDTMMATEPSEVKEEPSETQEDQIVAVFAAETHVQITEERAKSAQTQLKDRMKEMEEAVDAERKLWQQREAELRAELSALERDVGEAKEKESLTLSLERSLQESKEREKSLMDEASQRQTQFKELLRTLETEKDNLEERLMNQLAQLNGSIASYQQEAADHREHLAELQREAESLQRERAELEAEAQSEKERAARLEEDKRQAQRERAEAEAESGKQRELQHQLRSAQRVKEGSQSRARQLEELLREKQLEVRQLQKDCIQYQERISEQSREAKALQLSHHELVTKLQNSQSETSKTLQDLEETKAQLASCNSLLEESQKAASEALAAKTAVEQSIQQREEALKAEAEQTLDSVRLRLGAELKEMELRLEESYSDRDKEEEATLEAREMADGAERRAQETQARLDESLARLAAFSRCMSSLQDDRDRVLDEARQWESRFNGALQAKEKEIREAESRVKDLAEQLQKENAVREELQLSVSRLEKADKECRLKLEEEGKKLAEVAATLEKERRKLQETTAELQEAQSESRSLKAEEESLSQRTRALEEAVGRLQGEVEQARTELREREAEERRLCLSVEQLETDLRSSKALTESLQGALQEKEQREVQMLGEKEQAVAQAAEEARKEADSRARGAEEELQQKRTEVRDLGENLRKAQEESNNSRAKLESFTKAMGSLQDDRDRVLNIYKQLEEKHLQVMMEKDGLIQEAAAENNSLKEELRSLLVQRDDLYAEKAKLSSQIHNYREELNQVLSMKESQHRQQLAVLRERVASLERECHELEGQLRSLGGAREAEIQPVESEIVRQAASQVVNAPGAEVEKLREQLQASRRQVEALEESLQRERDEQEASKKELAELQWEGGVMRTESENAQERVQELAMDLLAVEQRLLQEREAAQQLRAEKEAFSRSMASLQNSRDQALLRVQELSVKLEEMSRMGGNTAAAGGGGGGSGEVWGLKNALQALQNDRERMLETLESQSSELKKQQADLARLGAGELIKVSQELLEERQRNRDMLGVVTELQAVVEAGKQEMETHRFERVDWLAQAEQLKRQTLATLSERDQQVRQLSAMLDEARTLQPKLQQEHYQREGTAEGDSAPGAPQEKSSLQDVHTYIAEVKELQRRLEEETQQRMMIEEQLTATEDRLNRYNQAKWTPEDNQSETAVFIEPSEGAVTRQTRRGGPGLVRMLRVAFCSRQRTPLLFSLYLLTVHVLLLLCMGGYL